MPNLNLQNLLNNLNKLSWSQTNNQYYLGVDKDNNLKVDPISNYNCKKIKEQSILAYQLKYHVKNLKPKITLQDRNYCSFELQVCLRNYRDQQYKIDSDFFPQRITVQDALTLCKYLLKKESKVINKCNLINRNLVNRISISLLSQLSSSRLTMLSQLIKLKMIVDPILSKDSIPNETKTALLIRKGIPYKTAKVLFSCDSYDELWKHFDLLGSIRSMPNKSRGAYKK